MSKQNIIHQNAKKFNEDCVAFDVDLQDLENNIPQSAWKMGAPNIAQDDSTKKHPRFLHITKSGTRKTRYHRCTESLQYQKYKRYIVHVVCKSSKKAGYEFSGLLQTCMQLEHTSMPDSNVQ